MQRMRLVTSASDERAQGRMLRLAKELSGLGWYWLLPVLLGLLGVVLLVGGARRDATYENALASVTEESVEGRFRDWAGTTFADGVALDWSGKTSEVLWIMRGTRLTSDTYGQAARSNSWVVWARSSNARYFTVEFRLEQNLILVDQYMRETSEAELLKTLIAMGETARIDKLRLPRKGA
jgi:hypothetical protein